MTGSVKYKFICSIFRSLSNLLGQPKGQLSNNYISLYENRIVFVVCLSPQASNSPTVSSSLGIGKIGAVYSTIICCPINGSVVQIMDDNRFCITWPVREPHSCLYRPRDDRLWRAIQRKRSSLFIVKVGSVVCFRELSSNWIPMLVRGSLGGGDLVGRTITKQNGPTCLDHVRSSRHVDTNY